MIRDSDLTPGNLFIVPGTSHPKWGAICYKPGTVRIYSDDYPNGHTFIPETRSWGAIKVNEDKVPLEALSKIKKEFPHLFEKTICSYCKRIIVK